jgi:hypothetical protein
VTKSVREFHAKPSISSYWHDFPALQGPLPGSARLRITAVRPFFSFGRTPLDMIRLTPLRSHRTSRQYVGYFRKTHLGYPFKPDFTVGILYRVKISCGGKLDLRIFFHFGILHARLMADSMKLLLESCRESKRVVPSCIQRPCVSGVGISFFLSSINALYYFSSYQVIDSLSCPSLLLMMKNSHFTLIVPCLTALRI